MHTNTFTPLLLGITALCAYTIGCSGEPGDSEGAIALGATIEFGTFDSPDCARFDSSCRDLPAYIARTESFHPDVLEITDVVEDAMQGEGELVQIKGLKVGVGVVGITTKEGKNLELTYDVREVARSTFYFPNGSSPLVLQGSSLEVYSTHYDSHDAPLKGMLAPVVTGGDVDIELDTKKAHSLTFRDAPAHYIISPAAKGEHVIVNTVSLAQVDGIAVKEHISSEYTFGVTHQGQDVRGIELDDFSVKVIAPEHCIVERMHERRGSFLKVSSLEEFEEKPDSCTFEVSIPGARGGQGLVKRLVYVPQSAQ
jgi:hypothetical protein